MKQALRHLFTAIGCLALAWIGFQRESAAVCFLAAILGVMLLSSARSYWIGSRLRSVQTVHQPIIPQRNENKNMVFLVTMTMKRPFPVLWLRVTEFWIRTGGEGGAWMCRRLLFPRRRQSLAFTSSFAGAPRGVYELTRIELQYGDVFGWFKHNVIIRPSEENAPVCVMAPDISTGNESANEQYAMEITESLGDSEDTSIYGTAERQLESAVFSTSLYGEGGEPCTSVTSGMRSAELRTYRAGDQWRSIDWRMYAKRRLLAVRVPEAGQLEQWDIAVDDTWWRNELTQHTTNMNSKTNTNINKNTNKSTNTKTTANKKSSAKANTGDLQKETKLLQQMEATVSAAAALVRQKMEAGHTVRLFWISDGASVHGARNAIIALAAEQLGKRIEHRWNYEEGTPSMVHANAAVPRRLAVVSWDRHSQKLGAARRFTGLHQVDQWLNADEIQRFEPSATRIVGSQSTANASVSAAASERVGVRSSDRMNDSENRGEYRVSTDSWTTAQG